MMQKQRKPTVVCLCGSSRFKEAFEKANKDETLAGNIVLTLGCYGHLEFPDQMCGGPLKERLDELHLRKIDLADQIFVLNVGGYIGESTRNEIEYARKHHKAIIYLETIT